MAVENGRLEDRWSTRAGGLRRRGDTDQWEVTLSRRNPITGEPERLYCIARGRTRRAAEKARDELIA
ncbi:hypothetical protein HMPREF1868_00981 [Olsenella sp. DNF00959]|nr:hypothetical protein HMPREF1868_00981 [Olsenella sp. DNF00959]